jgi:hypothetical protein
MNLSNQYKRYIRDFNSKSFNLINVMHALIISIKNEAEKSVAKFE